MRFCVASRLAIVTLRRSITCDEAGLGGLVARVEHVLLRLQDADDRVGLRQQFLQIAGQRHVAHAVGAHALLGSSEKMPMKRLPAGEALHVLEFGAEHVGRVLQPDDQVGDVAFHHLLLLQHVLDAGILDVEVGIADLGVGLGELAPARPPDCSILERMSSTTCLVLAISASKFCKVAIMVSGTKELVPRDIIRVDHI